MKSAYPANDAHIISGINTVLSALNSKLPMVCLYLEDNKHNQRFDSLQQLAEAQSCRIEFVNRSTLNLLAMGAKHQGVVAELDSAASAHAGADNSTAKLEQILQRREVLLLVLDGVTDPHNLGACLRSAAAANVDAVILPKDRAASVTPVVSKVACGAAEQLPIFLVTNLVRTLETLKAAGVWCVALTGDAGESLYQHQFDSRSAVILGAEGDGIREHLQQSADFRVHIPMLGEMESLNVSVATGVTLFEAVRQKLSP